MVLPLMIGAFDSPSRVFVAPMTGITDAPFRKLIRARGAGLVFSEMIASKMMVDALRGSSKASARYDDEYPLAVQLAGCEPDIVAEAARLNQDRGAAVIDINFGCPMKKIVTKLGGAALMRDEDLAVKIVEKTVKAVSLPVTVKMRLGWDVENQNAPTLAKRLEQAGAQMITVHGRTRCQMYQGKANWQAVAAVKQNLSIPVLVNGDITTPDQARQALEQSGADGVMIGRGACGRPWISGWIEKALIGDETPEPKLDRETVLTHYQDLLAHYGVQQGVRVARKHFGWYFQQSDLVSELRRCDDPAQVVERLNHHFDLLEAA